MKVDEAWRRDRTAGVSLFSYRQFGAVQSSPVQSGQPTTIADVLKGFRDFDINCSLRLKIEIQATMQLLAKIGHCGTDLARAAF